MKRWWKRERVVVREVGMSRLEMGKALFDVQNSSGMEAVLAVLQEMDGEFVQEAKDAKDPAEKVAALNRAEGVQGVLVRMQDLVREEGERRAD